MNIFCHRIIAHNKYKKLSKKHMTTTITSQKQLGKAKKLKDTTITIPKCGFVVTHYIWYTQT